MNKSLGHDLWEELENYLNECVEKRRISHEFLVQKLKFLPADLSVKTVENNDKIPMLIDAFIDFKQKNRRFPLQAEYVQHFIKINWHNQEIQRLLKRKNLRNALYLRLFRAYPSFVRDVILYNYLKRKGVDITYDYEMDIKGIDFVIRCNGAEYFIHCFVSAEAGKVDWRERKNLRHDFTGRHIDLRLKRYQSARIGDLMFYTKEQIDGLISATSQ